MAHDVKYDADFAVRLSKLSLKPTNTLFAQEEYEKLPKLPLLARPGHGTRGVPIELLVNWFRLNFDNPENKITVWFYEVTFTEIKRDAGRGRGRGRGRGGRGGGGAPQETNRANKQIAIWKAVEQLLRNGDINSVDDIVFDDHVVFVSKYLGQHGDVTVDHPNENINRKHQIRVSFRDAGCFPVDPNNPDQAIVDLSGRFIKALCTQRIRYLGGNQEEINFRSNWHFQNGSIFQIPRGLVNSQEDIELKVLPGIRAWLGLYAALKSGENQELYINFGLVNNLFYKMEMELITFYMEICEDIGETVDPPNFKTNLSRLREYGMSPIQQKNMQKLVKDLCVISDRALMFDEDKKPYKAPPNWRPGRPKPFLATRHFKVTKILDKCAHSFIVPEQNKTIAQLYHDLEQPLICPYLPIVSVSSGSRELYQPMEVLRIRDTPQNFKKILSENETKKFIQKVSRSPAKYKSVADKLLVDLNLFGQNLPFFQQYKAFLNEKWTPCESRILPPPVVREIDGKEHKLQKDRSYQIKEVAQSTGPIVMDVCTSIDLDTLEPILNDIQAGLFHHYLVKIMRERNMEVDPRLPQNVKAQYVPDKITDTTGSDPLYLNVDKDLNIPKEYRDKFQKGTPTFAAVASYCQKLFQKDKNHKKKRHILLVFTVESSDLFKRIKRVCDISVNVPTVIVDRDTVTKALKEADENKYAIFYNIALKINARLGGFNTLIDNPSELPPGERDQVMYVGIDVTHPGLEPGKGHWEADMNVSLAAIVGSIDVGSARYKTYPLAQMQLKETVERFDHQFEKLLRDFHEVNGNYPKHVVIYRDGVSDSEIERTMCTELNWIKGSWTKIVAACSPPTFTYIVVQKRHHTRFLRPVERNGEATYRNPPSGTTTDQLIVDSRKFDFWMTAHQASEKITARPIHYTVAYDEWKLSADQIQEMTYRLCFLNARCRKPCSLPVPVHYAHLACKYYKEVYRDYITHDDPSQAQTPERQRAIENSLSIQKSYPGMPCV